MAALTDISDLINRATGGNSGTPENVFFHKQARVAGAAAPSTVSGRPASLWRYDGSTGPGAAPTAVAVPTNATAGALPFTNPGGGREKHLIQAWATGLVAGTLILYDRLLHQGERVGNVATAQTVGGTLTRNTDGIGNLIWLEIYTIIGTTATTVTASYTNTTPTGGRTTTAVGIGATNFREVTRCIFLPLQAGDVGVRSVETFTLAATTGTAGAMGITIAKPLAYLGVGAPGAAGWRDFTTGMPGIPVVEANACLSLLWMPGTTTAPEIFGGYSFVEK